SYWCERGGGSWSIRDLTEADQIPGFAEDGSGESGCVPGTLIGFNPDGSPNYCTDGESGCIPGTIISFYPITFCENGPGPIGCDSDSPSKLNVLSPNGGEVYNSNSQILVTWSSCNFTNKKIRI